MSNATITDVDGKRHIKEITNTDVRGNTEIGYKKAEIPSSKKKAVAEVDNAAKYLLCQPKKERSNRQGSTQRNHKAETPSVRSV